MVDGTPEAIAAQRTRQTGLVIDLCHPLGRAAGGAYVEAARTGKWPAMAATAEHLPDSELEYALQDAGRPPIHAGVELPASLGGQVPYCDVAPPPVPSYRPKPPRRQLLHPTRKSPPRWPWVLAAAALIFVVIGVGVLAWTVRFGTDKGTAASESKKTKEVEVTVAKKPEETKSTEQAKKVEAPNATTKNADGKESKKAEEKQKQNEIATAKKMPEQGDATEDKKKGEAPKAAVAKNANDKETKTEQEKAKPDPFRDFRGKAYNVPRYKYVSVVGRNPSRPEWFPLAPLSVSRTRCEISLVTTAEMFPNKWRLRPLKKSTSDGASGLWDCILEKPTGMGGQTQTERIAGFRVDNKGLLNIKWNEDNKNADLANALRNCPLRVAMPDCDEAIVYLRIPASDSPIAFTDLTGQDHVIRQLSVDDMPDIPVEIETLAPLPTGITKPEMKNGNRQTWLLHAEADNTICFCLQVEHKGRDTNVVVTFTDQGVKLGEHTVYAYNIAAHIEEKEKEKEKKENEKSEKEKSLKAEKNDDKKKTLSDEIATITNTISGLQTHIGKAKAIEAVYGKLTNGGKLHYSVYLPINKYKVALIRTEQEKAAQDSTTSHSP